MAVKLIHLIQDIYTPDVIIPPVAHPRKLAFDCFPSDVCLPKGEGTRYAVQGWHVDM